MTPESPEEKLICIAREALRAHPTNPSERRRMIVDAVADDANLTLALFKDFQGAAIDKIEARARLSLAQKRAAARPAPKPMMTAGELRKATFADAHRYAIGVISGNKD